MIIDLTHKMSQWGSIYIILIGSTSKVIVIYIGFCKYSFIHQDGRPRRVQSMAQGKRREIVGDFQKSRSQHVLATESRGCQRDWRRKRVERYKKRECIPIPICHDTSGRLIIPQWYFKSSTWNIDRSKLGYPGKKPTLKQMSLVFRGGRHSVYVCGQCRQRSACRECTLQLLNGEDWMPCPICCFSDLAVREEQDREPPQQFRGVGRV